jgi:hypothetical protein
VENSCEYGNESWCFRKILRKSRVTEELVASQDGLSCLELVFTYRPPAPEPAQRSFAGDKEARV